MAYWHRYLNRPVLFGRHKHRLTTSWMSFDDPYLHHRRTLGFMNVYVRVEALAGTLAHSQRVDLHPPAQPDQGTVTSSSAYEGRSIPQSVPQPSFVRNVGEMASCDAPVNPRPPSNPIMSTQETTHHMDPVLHAGGDPYPTLALSVYIHHNKDGDEVPPTIPPSSHIDQSTTDPVISPGQMRLPEPQHGSVPTIIPFPSEMDKDGDRPLGVLAHHVSATSCAYVPSEPVNIGSEDALYVRQEQLEMECEPSIPHPRDFDGASTVEPTQSTTQDPTSKRAFDPLEVIRNEREQMHSEREQFNTEREHESAHELDNRRQLPFEEENAPQVAVAGPVEALRNQLADLTNLIRQMLALYGEKKVLMEQQLSEGLRWKEEWGLRIRELMDMVSWLVEDRAVAKQRKEHQGQADEDNPTWRADSTRQHEEIISAVRATANEQVPYNVQGYLDEFVKVLSSEVRVLLDEVGKLHEERRRIQQRVVVFEIGYLMRMQSTLAPGGEFGDWFVTPSIILIVTLRTPGRPSILLPMHGPHQLVSLYPKVHNLVRGGVLSHYEEIVAL
ncbi:hypothetical protein J3R83DRAFT_7145 [Lanmaoa asiatica]|nr:hypothetical protein J3R83DRAFT_7145 [Lanmaoa asiatica]